MKAADVTYNDTLQGASLLHFNKTNESYLSRRAECSSCSSPRCESPSTAGDDGLTLRGRLLMFITMQLQTKDKINGKRPGGGTVGSGRFLHSGQSNQL